MRFFIINGKIQVLVFVGQRRLDLALAAKSALSNFAAGTCS